MVLAAVTHCCLKLAHAHALEANCPLTLLKRTVPVHTLEMLMDNDVADVALLQQCGLSGCSRIIWDIKSSSDSSIDLQEDFCSEPSHCSDVDEQPDRKSVV